MRLGRSITVSRFPHREREPGKPLSAPPLPLPLRSFGDGPLRRNVLLEWAALIRRVGFHVSHPGKACSASLIFYALISLMLWLLFDRVLFYKQDGLYTGILNNYGDLPFHLSVISRFAILRPTASQAQGVVERRILMAQSNRKSAFTK